MTQTHTDRTHVRSALDRAGTTHAQTDSNQPGVVERAEPITDETEDDPSGRRVDD